MITPWDSAYVAIILIWELLLCIGLGELFCRAVCGYVLVRWRLGEVAFLFGYAVAALAGLAVASIAGNPRTIVPFLLLVAGLLYLLRRRDLVPCPEFLNRYRSFRGTMPGRLAVGSVVLLCCLVGSYRLPGIIHLVTEQGVVIGSNIYPDEMRTLGIPLSIAAHGLPLRFPVATDTRDVYPKGAFLLSAGHIAWAPRFAMSILVADSMAQTAIYGIAALLAAGLWIGSPMIGLFVVLSAVFSVSYNLWNLNPDEHAQWFLKLYGYYQINNLRSSIAWQPMGAMVWVMNHALAFSALLVSGMWLAAEHVNARRVRVWGPALLLGVFAYLTSLDIAVMSSVAIGVILAVELGRVGFRPLRSDWWLPAAAITLLSGLLFMLDSLPILLRQTEPPFFDPFPIIAQPWFNAGVLASTFGPYFLLWLVTVALGRFRSAIPWVWAVPVVTGLLFCLSFQYHSIWFWRFSIAGHLLLGIVLGLAMGRVTGVARVGLMVLWAVFLVPGVMQTRLVWLQGWQLGRSRPPEVVDALRWVQTHIPIWARVAELPSEQEGLVADVNYLRTGNAAGAAVTAAYHPQIGYRDYRTRMSSLANGIAGNDFIVLPVDARYALLLDVCGASKDYAPGKVAVYRITAECRASLLRDGGKAVTSAMHEEIQLREALATRQPEKLPMRVLQRYVLRSPDAMWFMRKQIEGEYWSKGRYREASQVLKPLTELTVCVAEAHYSFAYSLQMAKEELPEAIRHYDRALECGYAEFWVRYNRGGAYAVTGQVEKARADLQRARELNPGLQDVGRMLSTLPRR